MFLDDESFNAASSSSTMHHTQEAYGDAKTSNHAVRQCMGAVDTVMMFEEEEEGQYSKQHMDVENSFSDIDNDDGVEMAVEAEWLITNGENHCCQQSPQQKCSSTIGCQKNADSEMYATSFASSSASKPIDICRTNEDNTSSNHFRTMPPSFRLKRCSSSKNKMSVQRFLDEKSEEEEVAKHQYDEPQQASSISTSATEQPSSPRIILAKNVPLPRPLSSTAVPLCEDGELSKYLSNNNESVMDPGNRHTTRQHAAFANAQKDLRLYGEYVYHEAIRRRFFSTGYHHSFLESDKENNFCAASPPMVIRQDVVKHQSFLMEATNDEMETMIAEDDEISAASSGADFSSCDEEYHSPPSPNYHHRHHWNLSTVVAESIATPSPYAAYMNINDGMAADGFPTPKRFETVGDIIGYAKVVRAQRAETLGQLSAAIDAFSLFRKQVVEAALIRQRHHNQSIDDIGGKDNSQQQTPALPTAVIN